MSATPRPWMSVCNAPDTGCHGEDINFALRAVNAFDALLDVAKGAHEARETGLGGAMLDALAALDAAHPGWQDWA